MLRLKMDFLSSWQILIESEINQKLFEKIFEELILFFEECNSERSNEVISENILFINENLNNLIEEKPVLGAKSWFIDKIWEYKNKYYIVKFEDGHKLGYLFVEFSPYEAKILKSKTFMI